MLRIRHLFCHILSFIYGSSQIWIYPTYYIAPFLNVEKYVTLCALSLTVIYFYKAVIFAYK